MDPIAIGGGAGSDAGAPKRVFLSHTSDLGQPKEPESFVAAAVAAVQRARHAITDMAYFAACDTSPAAYCVEMVAKSDVYVGVIGLSYGSPVRDRPDVSYTELEFEAAGEHDKPRLIFLIREGPAHRPLANEPPELRARQDAFRARLQDSGLTFVWVSTPAELELALFHALVELAPPLLARAQTLLTSLPTDALAPHAPLPPGPRMPIGPNPLFVGRSEVLLHITGALRGGGTTVALGQVVASTGLGGLGKTQLAVELVHRYGRFFAGGVFWLSFANAEEIPLQVAACAGSGAVGLEADVSGRPVEERVKLVMGAWQSAVPRLLIFDNCEEESLLAAWRPTSGGCRVLVTSRRSHWSPTLGVTALPLDLLPRPDSIELLRRYRPDLAADDPQLDAIADGLGDLPLALHLAGRYLLAYRGEISLDDYLAELDQPELIRHASLLGEGLDDSPSPTHHVQSLAQTFALCLGRLDREREVDRVAIALLARMACLAPGEAVPRELLARTLEEVDARLRADGLRRLGAVGLVEKGEGWLRLHRLLVHFVRQATLDLNAQRAVNLALICSGEAADQGDLSRPALAAVIPHLIDAASRDIGDEPQLARLCNAAGLALWFVGDHRGARRMFERALTIRERVLGPDHADTAATLGNLAAQLVTQGEEVAARALLERAVAIRERVHGPEDADTAVYLGVLAFILWTQGESAAARSLFKRARPTLQRVRGPDHTAARLIVEAGLLQDEGKLNAARPLFERAVALGEQMLMPDHPVTAVALHNLGRLLRIQGELAAARSLFERAVDIGERVFGPDHPYTALLLVDLGRVLMAQGDLVAARSLLERGLAIRQRVLGSDHLYTGTSLIALGRVLMAQGDLVAARSLLERGLAIRQRALGSDHPATARSLNDLAELLQAQGELAAAKALVERALAIRERALGPDAHSDTAITRGLLANLEC